MKIIIASVVAAMSLITFGRVDATVDFSKKTGREINPWLHCAGFAPSFSNRGVRDTDELLTDLKLTALRTHDWALFNPGQRIIDTHFIFPLMHLDAKDPKNYYFKPTDDILALALEKIGTKVTYRLGTSIEHTGKKHYNILPPEDYDKYAEVLAGIVRHYTKGWADGFHWDIKYWEIWEEPDGIKNLWGGTGEPEAVLQKKFIKLFVTILKRLKSEFPEIKVGGPALAAMKEDYLRNLLMACKEAGVAPDFISWNNYGTSAEYNIERARIGRRLCNELGFTKTEIVLTEWHYLITWDGIHGNPKSASPDMYERAQSGPTGHNNIDAATYNTMMMCQLQKSGVYDRAYYYGCGETGNWGLVDRYRRPLKTYYSLKMIGEMVSACGPMVETEPKSVKIETLAAWSKDGKTAYLLVSGYRDFSQMITVDVKGLGNVRKVKATILDHTTNLLPAKFEFEDGVLSLFKNDDHSASFLVRFEMAP